MDLLATLGDRAAIPLLRDLVRDRCEGRVAWECQPGDWDDWLDVQIAAIRALGSLGVVEAIDDMMAARDDEYGQDLDAPVFAALSKMGTDGAAWLMAVARTESGPARRRALAALAEAAPESLRDLVDDLLADPEGDIRALAVPLLSPGDWRASALATGDPDPVIRRLVVLRHAGEDHDLAVLALGDPSEEVQAAALECLKLPLDPAFHETLVDNLLAWLQTASPTLAVAAVSALASLAPNRADTALWTLAQDSARPLEARVAAVSALGTLTHEDTSQRLIALLGAPAQQIRTVALTALTGRAAAGDAEAGAALAAAIRGDLLEDAGTVVPESAEPVPDLAASRGEARRPALRISPDGEIVETDDETAGQSTLGALGLAPPSDKQSATLAPSRQQRRRRPVDGPDDISADLARSAMVIAGRLALPVIERAVAAQAASTEDTLRQVAWTALAERAVVGGAVAHLPLASGLADAVPAVRAAAARIALADHGCPMETIERLVADEDALLRAAALRCGRVPAECLSEHLTDRSPAVRAAAIDGLLRNESETAAGVVASLLKAGMADSLAQALSRSVFARDHAIGLLGCPRTGDKSAYVLLQALGMAATSPAPDEPPHPLEYAA